MKLVVVAEDALTRAGSRLTRVLQFAHEAEQWSSQRFEANVKQVRELGGVIFLGDTYLTRTLRPIIEVKYNNHGVIWGYRGKKALICAYGVTAPELTLERMQGELDAIQREAWDAQSAKDALSLKPEDVTGRTMAHLYLDPDLKVEAMTMAGNAYFDFSPARMLWERQHTLGIVTFLNQGIDDFLRADTKAE